MEIGSSDRARHMIAGWDCSKQTAAAAPISVNKFVTGVNYGVEDHPAWPWLPVDVGQERS